MVGGWEGEMITLTFTDMAYIEILVVDSSGLSKLLAFNTETKIIINSSRSD